MPLTQLVPAVASMLALAGTPAHGACDLTFSNQDSGGRVTTVTLRCEPDGGSHPHAARACQALEAADGDFDRLTGQDQPCPMIWQPVTATATGHWRGRPVQYSHTYPNRCEAAVRSAQVFDF
ncbi:hypothetical protein FNH05_21000 [Amycolatopsis rhizosphaerae]|uniref:Subtilisin inhibitor domain-containing protein n=1 Tax=Amycolatopsis rhizosphaerae TaxID=2053003 RepID=A0A558C7X0_9PSEU|nr:SSI family serine proteinase inhibitor [Amycolatopsis rhizosphaerae]TVT44891.1 hypothetical protein FNH05_21000 [Amycolatopsis rhizosphaerae]